MKSTSKMTKYAGSLYTSSTEDYLRYSYAHNQGAQHVLVELSRKQSVRSQFNFMLDIYDQKVAAGEFQYLPLPYFNTDKECFVDIVRKLAGPKFTKGSVKKFGTCLEKYGVNFLNNYFEYNFVIDEWNINPDDLFNLDHAMALPKDICHEFKKSGVVFKRYTLERIHILLTTYHDEDLREDIVNMAQRLDFLPPDELREMLPKKPKNLLQLHDAISESLLKWRMKNVPLEQDLAFLNGQVFEEFIIEVPMMSHDLADTSRELKHCVHSYWEKVLQKKCQIINLVKDGKRVYTVELFLSAGKYEIFQFKGFANNSSMETEAGRPYQEKLLGLIHAYLAQNSSP